MAAVVKSGGKGVRCGAARRGPPRRSCAAPRIACAADPLGLGELGGRAGRRRHGGSSKRVAHRAIDPLGLGELGERRPKKGDVETRANSGAVGAALATRPAVRSFMEFGVAEDVVKRAVEAARATPLPTPLAGAGEPWRWTWLGPDTVAAVADLAEELAMDGGASPSEARSKGDAVRDAPGAMLVTARHTGERLADERARGACLVAMHNFALALWDDGVASRCMAGALARSDKLAALVGAGGDARPAGLVLFGFPEELDEVTGAPARYNVEDLITRLP